jgi:phosphoglycolate phosphatase
MNRYDLVVFDLDGTILDTSEGLLSALKFSISEFGYPIPTKKVLDTFIGPPVQDSFSKTYGVNGETLKKMADLFRDRYKNEDLLLASPYEGIYQVLQTILNLGIRIAIATYKREDYAIKLLRHFSFDNYACVMHGSDFAGSMKKRDIIQICISEVGIEDFNRVLMIGDTCHDAEGADNLGIDFVGVTYGFGYKSNDTITGSRVVGCAETPEDILRFL